MQEDNPDLIFNRIRVSYPEKSNIPETILIVEDITLIEEANQIRVKAKTEKGVLTILHLIKE